MTNEDVGNGGVVLTPDGKIAVIGLMNTVLGLNAATGSIEWNYTHPNPSATVRATTPGISADGTWAVVGINSVGGGGVDLVGLDPRSGSVLWINSYNYPFAANLPVIVGSVAVVGMDAIYALNGMTGALLWRSTAVYPNHGNDGCTYSPFGNRLICSGNGARVALSLTSGAVDNSFRDGPSADYRSITSADASDATIMNVGYGPVAAFNSANGAVDWQFQLSFFRDGGCFNAAFPGMNQTFFATDGSNLYAFTAH